MEKSLGKREKNCSSTYTPFSVKVGYSLETVCCNTSLSRQFQNGPCTQSRETLEHRADKSCLN